MGWTNLLTGKTKVGVEEFCQGLYDEVGYQDIGARGAIHQIYSDVVYDSLVQADSNFAQIDREILREELIPLRMVIVLLALGHRTGNENLLLRGFLFTKKYLKAIGREDLWEILVHYNKVITASMQEFIVATQNERGARAQCAFINSMRFGIAEKYVKQAQGDDEIACCVGQAINQLYTERAWKGEYTLKSLVGLCVYRLGWVKVHGETLEPKSDALLRLAVALLGFYDGTQCALKSVALK